MKARKLDTASMHAPSTTGFNGAAPMKARKSLAGGEGVANHMSRLQWSRADEGAEIWDRLLPPKAESCFNGAAPMKARKCLLRRSPLPQPRRFNGAAPMKARKCLRNPGSGMPHRVASMEPRR